MLSGFLGGSTFRIKKFDEFTVENDYKQNINY